MSLDWTFSETPIPTDVDECSSGASCGPHGHCTNTEGSFRCSCAAGYRAPAGRPGPCAGGQLGRGRRALEWSSGVLGKACEAGGGCTKGLWVELKSRPSGVRLGGGAAVWGRGCCLGGGAGVRAAGRQPFLSRTLDVNECLEGDFCFPHGECLNTDGSFACTCAPGYRPGPRGASCLGLSPAWAWTGKGWANTRKSRDKKTAEWGV